MVDDASADGASHARVDHASECTSRKKLRWVARDEAIFAGTSTGANVVAALRIAARLGAGKTVATLIVDSSPRHPSADFAARNRLQLHGNLC